MAEDATTDVSSVRDVRKSGTGPVRLLAAKCKKLRDTRKHKEKNAQVTV